METTAIVSDYELERHKPMPSINHGSIQANLIIGLAAYRNTHRIASEVSLDLNDFSSVPDISIFEKMKIDTKNDIPFMKIPPLCVVEIISPSQSFNEILTKTYSYFQNGVKSCWIVLPGVNNIYVFSGPDTYQIFKSDQTLQDPTLNISFSLAEVFV
jgi:Uma2 family endonuclease